MDIQDLKDAQAEQIKKAEIEVSEQKYRSLAEAIPQIVFTSPSDGEVNYFNRRWYEFTGIFLAHKLPPLDNLTHL
jgi:PAS domain-containing protein